MAKELEKVFEKEEVELPTEINTTIGAMVIYNPGMKNISLNRDLAGFLGIGQSLLLRGIPTEIHAKGATDYITNLAQTLHTVTSHSSISTYGISLVESCFLSVSRGGGGGPLGRAFVLTFWSSFCG